MAGRCLEWLAEHSGLREGHCLALDAERNRLVHVAGFGVQPVTVNGFGIDLEAHDHHPLVKALTVPRPVVLAPETAGRLFSRRATLPGPAASRRGPTGSGRPEACFSSARSRRARPTSSGSPSISATDSSARGSGPRAPSTSAAFAGIGISCGASSTG